MGSDFDIDGEGDQMNAVRLERIARAQAKTLRVTLKLFSEIEYLDSYGQALEGQLDIWLDHTKPIRKKRESS